MGNSVNLALNKTVAASGYVMPYSPSKAVNGAATATTPMNRWLCNSVSASASTSAWLRVDLGAVYFINRWVVKHMGMAWPTNNYNMSDFKLQGSNDNSNWYDIDIVSNNTLAITDRIIPLVKYRYVRVYVTKGLQSNNQLASIMALEVYQGYSGSLSNLVISQGTLAPVFSSSTLSYTASVGYNQTSIMVTPTVEDATAKVTVNGTAVASGTASQAINLNVGSNTINVAVTQGDGQAGKTYTITVTRLGNSDLKGLSLSNGTLQPIFDKGTISYTASVDSDTTSVTVTPTKEDPTAVIMVNGQTVVSGSASQPINLNVGNNTINVIVQGYGVVSKTYTITVMRPSSFYLTNLVVKGGRGNIVINPTFDRNTIGYTASVVGTTITSVSITPSAEDINAVIKVNGTVVANNTQSSSITLNTGVNNIYVTVTSNTGGIVRTYTVAVSK